MYEIPKKEELRFLKHLVLTQVCCGIGDIRLHFFDESSRSYEISISYTQPDLLFVEDKHNTVNQIKSVEDYGKICVFLDKKITDIDINPNAIILIFGNQKIGVNINNNGYEILTITNKSETIII